MDSRPPAAAPPVPPLPREGAGAGWGWGASRRRAFLLIAAQLGLILVVIRRFEIESRAFQDLALVAFGGFALHAFLPSRLRLPFFALLSLAAAGMILGVTNGLLLLLIGLVLIGLCHLPIPFFWRGALLAAAGLVAALMRAGRIDVPLSAALWPIVGSMFMFRLIVYFYDIRHARERPRFWETVAYFFMLPNVCFPLFPVVDFSSFRRTRETGDPFAERQTGVRWIVRGVVQLVLYRLVYYHFTIDPAAVAGPASLARFLLSNFLLYLRISGQFHLIAGFLRLYGFFLPETHHYYYFASSFTDFWRRINIYWKDFMMKIFYYPLFFSLRKRGTSFAMAAATIAVFLITWLLHSYQWFWLLGDFPLTAQDVLFWSILGLLVLVGTFHEARHGRKRSLGTRRFRIAGSGRLIVQTALTFAAICVLWSLWTCDSLDRWLALWSPRTVSLANALAAGGLFLVAAAITTGGPLLRSAGGRGGGKKRGTARRGPSITRSVALSIGTSLVLIFLSLPAFYGRLGAGASDFIASLRTTRLSDRDTKLLERGYYEKLIGVGRINSRLWELYTRKPDWPRFARSAAAEATDDFIGVRLVPGARIDFHGARLSINRWGMRDRDYRREKAPGTYRIAVLGSSHTMGSGVGDDETFENRLEEMWNASLGEGEYDKVEILNFAVAGHTPLQQLGVLTDVAFAFDLDAVLFTGHPSDKWKNSEWVGSLFYAGTDLRYDHLLELRDRIAIDSSSKRQDVSFRLISHNRSLLAWTYGRIAAACRERGVVPILVLIPRLEEGLSDADAAEILELAAAAGFEVIDLSRAYDGLDPESLQVAPWDHHPNAKGHRRIAEALRESLAARPGLLPVRIRSGRAVP